MYTQNILKGLLPALLLLCFTSLSAQNWWKNGISGEGPSVNQTLDVNNFDEFSLNINAMVRIRQGSRQEVKIEAQQNIIDNILTEVNDGNWKIKYDRPVRKSNDITIWITVPKLEGAHISGSGSIRGEGTFTGLDEMDVSISGSGDIEMGLEANEVESSISGSGDILLSGRTGSLEVHISGSGDVEAFDMLAQDVDVHISGSGDVGVHAEGDLVISTSGSGDVVYSGRPKVKARVSGSGDVSPRE